MIVLFDTTFLALHYFSKEPEVLSKTKRILSGCRRPGNKGILATIVLAEFHALTLKVAGRDAAEKYFNEAANSGLSLAVLTADIAKQAAILRHKYHEKIPWGDCVIAATGLVNKCDFILTENHHFADIKETKARRLSDVSI